MQALLPLRPTDTLECAAFHGRAWTSTRKTTVRSRNLRPGASRGDPQTPCTVTIAGAAAALFAGGLRLGRRLGSLQQGPLAGWRRSRLAKLFDGGATLRLQYPKEDLGFVYSEAGEHSTKKN